MLLLRKKTSSISSVTGSAATSRRACKHYLFILLFCSFLLVPMANAQVTIGGDPRDAATQAEPEENITDTDVSADSNDAAAPLSDQVEDLKQSVLDLNRDLLILEEELLFPANTQIAVFLSMDVGEFFQLDSVKLLIDNKMVASELYTPHQTDALFRGGVQRLYVGNLRNGSHEVTAFFTGIGPEGREYKRGSTVTVDKDLGPKMLELRIVDSTKKLQPVFDIKEWQP